MDREKLKDAWRRIRIWARRRVPPGARTILGLLLIVGGVFGFLPVLGFWMMPLGALMIWFDLLWVWRWLRRMRR